MSILIVVDVMDIFTHAHTRARSLTHSNSHAQTHQLHVETLIPQHKLTQLLRTAISPKLLYGAFTPRLQASSISGYSTKKTRKEAHTAIFTIGIFPRRGEHRDARTSFTISDSAVKYALYYYWKKRENSTS